MMDTIRGRNMSNAYADLFEHEDKFLKKLSEADINVAYVIQDIVTEDEEMKNFLFSLGCFKGEPVTIISILAENFVIAIKDGRYSIDSDLAEAIII